MQLGIPRLPMATAEAGLAYRDENEGIKIRMVAVPAKDYLRDVTLDPTKEQVDELFTLHRNSAPGEYFDENDFGFGYLIPRYVNLHYLLLDSEIINRICEPFESEIEKEYADNRAEYTKEVNSDEDDDAAGDADSSH